MLWRGFILTLASLTSVLLSLRYLNFNKFRLPTRDCGYEYVFLHPRNDLLNWKPALRIGWVVTPATRHRATRGRIRWMAPCMWTRATEGTLFLSNSRKSGWSVFFAPLCFRAFNIVLPGLHRESVSDLIELQRRARPGLYRQRATSVRRETDRRRRPVIVRKYSAY